VYDLGCGDGRVVIEAARRYGARGVGIEYDARLCEEARRRASEAGVEGLVTIRHEDVTKSDFSDATVVMLYLLPRSNEILRPKIQALKPGTRVVAHDYTIGDWKPITVEVVPLDGAFEHALRLWRVGE
jgi:SAM-dependent methyltransferase